MSRPALLLCATAFWLSGASALTYEILWQRRMFLIFGASAPATTAILTAIFLGIAFGSRLAMPVMRRIPDALLFYAGLEIVMGVWGILVPTMLSAADRLYVASVGVLGEGHALQAPLRFALAVVPLLPATLAMGATIPVMIRCVSRASATAVGWAYGINILGAVVGCVLTGFLWIERLGLHNSRFVAAGLNAAAVVVILLLRRRVQVLADDHSNVAGETSCTAPRVLAYGYFVAGFVALGLEVVWLRLLGIVNTNSSATFTLTLTLYLLGMGLGSLLAYPVLKRLLTPRQIFCLANGGTAVAALLTFGVVYEAASINVEQIVEASKRGALTLGGIYRTEAQIIASLMLLPTMFMGLAYPAVCDSFPNEGPARDRWVGRAYFVGTLGSVAGILLVASWIIPRLGLHGSFALLICLSLGVCVASSAAPQRPWASVGVLLICLAGGVWAVALARDPRPVLRETRAVKRDGRWLEAAVGDPQVVLSELERVRAGTTATVMVKTTLGRQEHLIYVDDQLVASTNLGARVDSLMLAHLPLLLHPDPQCALTVGFGTGGTSFAMTTHDVETYCVEIEAEVPRSAHLLADQNFNILDHSRFTLILNDARDHLHAGTRTYDVIATDVTNLQYKQNGNLYTVEYFELMRDKLNPGGVACAWIPMAAIDLRELKILMRGFREVFPHATLWFMNHTHTNFGILIGTPGRLAIDYRRLQQGFENTDVAGNLSLVGMTNPLQFIHCLHLDEDGLGEFCAGVPLHTDDRPILEFSSPMSFYNYYETFEENLAQTLQLRPDDFRPYVEQFPEGMEEEFARHRVASQSFCEVLLLMYTYMVDRERGRHAKVVDALQRAIAVSKSGMQALPGDKVRESFYIDFFSDAQRWLEGR